MRAMTPEPFIERTRNGLRPSRAAHVERWASCGGRARRHRQPHAAVRLADGFQRDGSARGALMLLLAATLSGCVNVPVRSARIECVRPAGEAARFLIALTAPTGHWGVSGHGLAIYREVQWVSIRLPEEPPAQAEYGVGQVVVTEESYPPRVIAIVSGSVRVDRGRAQVSVALQATSGPFWANGTYSIKGRCGGLRE